MHAYILVHTYMYVCTYILSINECDLFYWTKIIQINNLARASPRQLKPPSTNTLNTFFYY